MGADPRNPDFFGLDFHKQINNSTSEVCWLRFEKEQCQVLHGSPLVVYPHPIVAIFIEAPSRLDFTVPERFSVDSLIADFQLNLITILFDDFPHCHNFLNDVIS